jgi:hypothetical protein
VACDVETHTARKAVAMESRCRKHVGGWFFAW